MVRRPFCEVSFHHHFLQRLRLVGSVAPHFQYIYEYGVYMDKFTYISERTVGKEQVDVIHFLRIMGAKHQIRQKFKKLLQAITIVCNKRKTCCKEILLIPSAIPTSK